MAVEWSGVGPELLVGLVRDGEAPGLQMPRQLRDAIRTERLVAPKKVDHWITEYWSSEDRQWVRINAECLDRPTPGSARTEDLRVGEFLDSGEAWQLVRSALEDRRDRTTATPDR